jgi:hypothetical protein
MRVRRQTAIGKFNASAIQEFADARDSDEHRRVTGLGDADGRGSLRVPSLQVPLSSGQLTLSICTSPMRHEGVRDLVERR